jgi:phosphatidylglycerol---prolipoprotein diacylglyceryl transferase
MIYFLHTFNPDPVLVSFGFIRIYWYGMFIVIGILCGIFITFKLAEYYNLNKEALVDFAFWLIITGVVGARIYHVLLEYDFYLKNPLNIFKIWNGGLAIHGAIIGGVLTIWYLTKKYKLNFWLLGAIIVPAMSLAQAIGRWGNYFNQELFGKPTNLPWGIPISIDNRNLEFYNSQYFHPTFLYESIGDLIIFLILILLHYLVIKKKIFKDLPNFSYQLIFFSYLILYSLLRFITEFIRIDSSYVFFGLRWPQIVSMLVVIFSVGYMFKINKKTLLINNK